MKRHKKFLQSAVHLYHQTARLEDGSKIVLRCFWIRLNQD